MKLDALMKFAEDISGSVRNALDALEKKVSDSLSGISSEVKSVKDLATTLATAEEVDAIRASINSQAEFVSDEIERRVKAISLDSGKGAGVKSIKVDDGKLILETFDGSSTELDIPVVAGPPGDSGLDGSNGVDGKDGRDGVDGKDGENGADGIDGKDGRDGIDGQNGEKGADGVNGSDGRDGKDGKDGRDGADGKDGVGIAGVKSLSGSFALLASDGSEYVIELPKPAEPDQPRQPVDITDATIGRDGGLILVFSNGHTKDLGVIVGRDGLNGRDGSDGAQGERGLAGMDGRDGIDGKDGRDGIDGLGFDDMTIGLMEDGRTFNFMFARGDNVKEFKVKIPAMIFRGGYDSERVYEEGDTVQFVGSTYVAKRETVGVAPGTPDAPWSLATSAGRTVRGPQGLSGRDGRNGRDGIDRFRPY